MMKIDLTLDYHSHILPGCDHGSDGLATSLKQVEMARDAGIRTICATSHFYPDKDTADSFLKRRNKAALLLKSHLPEGAPRVLLGAEVLICAGMERYPEDLRRLCLEGTNQLLLELPFYEWPESIWDTLLSLCEDQDEIEIVIAHANRYPAENIMKLVNIGVPLQLNTECLMSPFHRGIYMSWIKKGYVSYLGSDIHMLGNGYKEWTKCKKLLKEQGGR